MVFWAIVGLVVLSVLIFAWRRDRKRGRTIGDPEGSDGSWGSGTTGGGGNVV